MNCILIPTLGMDIPMLDRAVNSIDIPIANKAIINNGKRGSLDEWASRNEGWVVFDQEVNLGVAASWNLAPSIFPNHDQWMIVNDDFVFQKGQLELMRNAAYENKEAPTVHFTETEGYNCFIWRRSALDTIGYFDENFYPAYYEDYDYRMRMRLLGLKPCIVGIKDSEIVHGKGRSGGPNYRKFMDEVDVLLRDYYELKWGEVTDTPNENTDKKPVTLIKMIEEKWRENLKSHWAKFVEQGNTIYD